MCYGDEIRPALTSQAEEAPGPDGKTRSKAVVPDDEDAWVETHVGRSESGRLGSTRMVTLIPKLLANPP